MKKLFIKVCSLSIIFFSITVFLILGTSFLVRKSIILDIPHGKSILVIGDSHAECAINDNVLDSIFNFSQSGSGYFYSYLKVREIIKQNPHINTIIVGYSYGDLVKDRDDWFSGKEKLTFKLPDHFFLFNFKDFVSLFSANPYDVLISCRRVVEYNIRYLLLGRALNKLGGYQNLKRQKLQEAIERYVVDDRENQIEISQYQISYLLEIYNLSQAENLRMVLLNTPVHPIMEEGLRKYKKYYYELATEKMPNAIVLNYSNFQIPENGFADLGHLNYRGAKIFSNFLKNSHIFPLRPGKSKL